MTKGVRMLLLGVYGMEAVECGGVLCKNAQMGGKSFASIMLASKKMREQVQKAADILDINIGFTDFTTGEITVVPEAKKKLIRVIRECRPDIIITQDPEHSFSDLDPDRRLAMVLILESIALAAREYALDEMPGLEAHPIPTIYYMTPEKPNCIVDISDIWDRKEQAMDQLESQLEFSGEHYEQYYGAKIMEKIVPGWGKLESFLEKGRQGHKQIDRALHLYQGATGHSRFAFAETYRREGKFHLDNLVV